MSLGQAAAARGYRLERFDDIASTNDLAMARAREGDPGRLWIVADTQSAGRGRLGRAWSSPPGNLFASLLLIDPAPANIAPQLGFAAGVALMRALETLGLPSGLARLKWPNDALLAGAKLAGILLEAATLPSGRLALVIGIGVNCVAHPEGLPYPATSLAAQGWQISAEALSRALSDAMAGEIETWSEGAGFPLIRRAWLERAAGLGAPIEVVAGNQRRAGVFRQIDEQGRLVLAAKAGEFIVDAGDVVSLFSSPPGGGGGQGIN